LTSFTTTFPEPTRTLVDSPSESVFPLMTASGTLVPKVMPPSPKQLLVHHSALFYEQERRGVKLLKLAEAELEDLGGVSTTRGGTSRASRRNAS